MTRYVQGNLFGPPEEPSKVTPCYFDPLADLEAESAAILGQWDLEVFSIEDLDTLPAKIEAARARAHSLSPVERAREESRLLVLERELEAQRANERRRRR